jgi:hypothetical protein
MRRGFSSTEVLVGIAIFATAMIPIITLIAGGTRPTAFNEYHVLAHAVATESADRLIERILTRGFQELEKMGIGDKVDVEETQTYKAPAVPDDSTNKKQEFVGAPAVHITNLAEPSGSLIRISVTVPFTIPGDNHKHSYTLERLFCRPDVGLMGDYELTQIGGGAVP